MVLYSHEHDDNIILKNKKTPWNMKNDPHMFLTGVMRFTLKICYWFWHLPPSIFLIFSPVPFLSFSQTCQYVKKINSQGVSVCSDNHYGCICFCLWSGFGKCETASTFNNLPVLCICLYNAWYVESYILYVMTYIPPPHRTDRAGSRTGDSPPGELPPDPVPLLWEPQEAAISKVAMNFLLEPLPSRLSLRVEKPMLNSSSTQQL